MVAIENHAGSREHFYDLEKHYPHYRHDRGAERVSERPNVKLNGYYVEARNEGIDNPYSDAAKSSTSVRCYDGQEIRRDGRQERDALAPSSPPDAPPSSSDDASQNVTADE